MDPHPATPCIPTQRHGWGSLSSTPLWRLQSLWDWHKFVSLCWRDFWSKLQAFSLLEGLVGFLNQRKKGLFFMNACETKILAVITTRRTTGKQQVGVQLSWGIVRPRYNQQALWVQLVSVHLCCQSCKQARVAVQKDGSREQATALRTQEAHCFYQLYFAHILWSLNIFWKTENNFSSLPSKGDCWQSILDLNGSALFSILCWYYFKGKVREEHHRTTLLVWFCRSLLGLPKLQRFQQRVMTYNATPLAAWQHPGMLSCRKPSSTTALLLQGGVKYSEYSWPCGLFLHL